LYKFLVINYNVLLFVAGQTTGEWI